MASNMMELMKSKFAAMSRAELSLTARSANDNLVIGLMSGDLQNMLLVADYTFVKKCLKLGFCTRNLSQKQKWLINELFPHNYQNTVETITAAAIEAISDDDYKLIGAFAEDPKVSEALFNLLMCAAYADGGLKKEVEDRIDPIFGMLFLALFADSGLESVPAPPSRRPHVTGLEARLLDYMLNQKTLMPLNDIVKAFPGETKAAIKKALDGLCEKELVNWYSNVILEPYGVEVDREDVDIVLSDNKPTAAKKTETMEQKETPTVTEEEKQKKYEEFEKKLQAAKEKLKEEEAKRAAFEEKKRQENAEKEAYETAVNEWKLAVQKVKKDRECELERRKEAREKVLITEYDRILSLAKKEAEYAKESAKKKKETAQETISALGVFKFSEKKEQKALIAEAEEEIEKAEQHLFEAENAHDASLEKINELLEQYKGEQKKEVEKRFPLPKEPQKPAFILRAEQEVKKEKERKEAEEKAKWDKMTDRQKENETIRRKIAAAMPYGVKMRCPEIKALVPELEAELGTQRTARLCDDLEREGILEKTFEQKVIYFRLIKKTSTIPTEEKVKTETTTNNTCQSNIDFETENIVIMEKIIKALEPKRWYQIAEIKELVPELAKGVGTARTTRVCFDLDTKYGILEKKIENKIVFLRLAE